MVMSELLEGTPLDLSGVQTHTQTHLQSVSELPYTAGTSPEFSWELPYKHNSRGGMKDRPKYSKKKEKKFQKI